MNEIAINVDSLTVFYGKYCVIRDITFSINKNEFVTIVGPNGGGKTTLLKAILGLVEPTNGKIEVFSKPPKELDFHEIGYVPQIKNLDRTFPAKVIELVATG
jgi:ABC-type Mn/Zn transport systems, ATPase component